MTIPTPTQPSLEQQRDELERTRQELRQRIREGLPRGGTSLRLPTKEELDSPLNREGPGWSGTISALVRTGSDESNESDDGFLVVDRPDQIIDTPHSIRLICVRLDCFDSIEDIAAWFERNEPILATRLVMLPHYWVVGSRRLESHELDVLIRVGARYEQLPAGTVDVEAWLRRRYPRPKRDAYIPSQPKSPLEQVEPTFTGTSSVDSWEQDRRAGSEAHVRALRRKDELLEKTSDDNDPT